MEMLGTLHTTPTEQELHLGLQRDKVGGEPCPSEVITSQFKVTAITF